MPESNTTLTPHLCCRNAEEAYGFYQRAFGAVPQRIIKSPDGKVMHGHVTIEGNSVYLVDEFPAFGALSPLSLNGSPVTMHMQVPDCDAVFAKAVEAGCEAKMPPQDMFWGDRYGLVQDPYGHLWAMATTVRQVGNEELQQAIASMTPECGNP